MRTPRAVSLEADGCTRRWQTAAMRLSCGLQLPQGMPVHQPLLHWTASAKQCHVGQTHRPAPSRAHSLSSAHVRRLWTDCKTPFARQRNGTSLQSRVDAKHAYRRKSSQLAVSHLPGQQSHSTPARKQFMPHTAQRRSAASVLSHPMPPSICLECTKPVHPAHDIWTPRHCADYRAGWLAGWLAPLGIAIHVAIVSCTSIHLNIPACSCMR